MLAKLNGGVYEKLFWRYLETEAYYQWPPQAVDADDDDSVEMR